MDIRRDDSVFSYGFPVDDLMLPGTVVEVTKIRIENVDLLSMSQRRGGNRTKRRRGSELYTMDQEETECCGSFVENPDLVMYHDFCGFLLILFDNLPSVVTEEVSL